MAMIVSRFESDFENCPTAEIVRDPDRDCIHRRDDRRGLGDKGGKGDAETRRRGDAEGHPVRSATHRLRDPASTLPSDAHLAAATRSASSATNDPTGSSFGSKLSGGEVSVRPVTAGRPTNCDRRGLRQGKGTQRRGAAGTQRGNRFAPRLTVSATPRPLYRPTLTWPPASAPPGEGDAAEHQSPFTTRWNPFLSNFSPKLITTASFSFISRR